MFGIIGGMGPLASALFYELVTEKTAASGDQDNPDMILLSHASMPDRTDAILSADNARMQEIEDKLLADALFLTRAGCSHIVTACNTAHYFIDRIEARVPVPFLHLIRETVQAVKRARGAEDTSLVALLATEGTVRTRLYQDRLTQAGIPVFVPDTGLQKKVTYEIYSCVKAGKEADAACWKEIESELKNADCGSAVLGCTELSVVRRELLLDPSFYFDPLDIVADHLAAIHRSVVQNASAQEDESMEEHI